MNTKHAPNTIFFFPTEDMDLLNELESKSTYTSTELIYLSVQVALNLYSYSKKTQVVLLNNELKQQKRVYTGKGVDYSAYPFEKGEKGVRVEVSSNIEPMLKQLIEQGYGSTLHGTIRRSLYLYSMIFNLTNEGWLLGIKRNIDNSFNEIELQDLQRGEIETIAKETYLLATAMFSGLRGN